MQHWPGTTIGMNESIPKAPRLLTVKEPSSRSVSFSLFVFAFVIRVLESAATWMMFLFSIFLITGTMRPSSTAIASPTFMVSTVRMLSPSSCPVMMGNFSRAIATALMMKSLKATLVSALRLTAAR